MAGKLTDRELELAWRGLVSSFPGETHEDRILSALLYTARELGPVESKIKRVRVEFDDGRVVDATPWGDGGADHGG